MLSTYILYNIQRKGGLVGCYLYIYIQRKKLDLLDVISTCTKKKTGLVGCYIYIYIYIYTKQKLDLLDVIYMYIQRKKLDLLDVTYITKKKLDLFR